MGKYTIHINAEPGFFKSKKNMDLLEEMCKRAYHGVIKQKPKKK